MSLGILALAPPVGFFVQLFGTTSLCGTFCMRHLVGSSFVKTLAAPTPAMALFLTWLGITLLFGRWACSHICPIGALTEFGSKLVPGRVKIHFTRHLDAPLFRYGFLAAYIALPLLGAAAISCSFCNFSSISEAFGSIFIERTRPGLLSGTRLVSLLFFGGFLGLLALDGRGHCHLACPVGAVDSIVNWAGSKLPFAFRERVRADACNGCGTCARACPAAAITVDQQVHKASIDQWRCYQCRRCEAKCAKGAIGITRPLPARGTLVLPQPDQGEPVC
jgi:ferredoxin